LPATSAISSTVVSPGTFTCSKMTPWLRNSVTVATTSSTVNAICVKVPGDAPADSNNANSPLAHR
jgi:hypothetical protein